MLPSVEPNPQLRQLASLPPNARLSAGACTRVNLVGSVFQERGVKDVSAFYRCRVMERNNFRKATNDLPRIIE